MNDNSAYNTFDPTLRIYKEAPRENKEPSESKEPVIDWSQDLGKVRNNTRITLDKMPYDERNKTAADKRTRSHNKIEPH